MEANNTYRNIKIVCFVLFITAVLYDSKKQVLGGSRVLFTCIPDAIVSEQLQGAVS